MADQDRDEGAGTWMGQGPAAHLTPAPADFTPPHGDKLLRRR
jgi:hypothetical protein